MVRMICGAQQAAGKARAARIAGHAGGAGRGRRAVAAPAPTFCFFTTFLLASTRSAARETGFAVAGWKAWGVRCANGSSHGQCGRARRGGRVWFMMPGLAPRTSAVPLVKLLMFASCRELLGTKRRLAVR